MHFSSSGVLVTLEFRWEGEHCCFVLGVSTPNHTLAFLPSGGLKRINRRSPQGRPCSRFDWKTPSLRQKQDLNLLKGAIALRFLLNAFSEKQQHFHALLWTNPWREAALLAQANVFSNSHDIKAHPILQVESLPRTSWDFGCGSLSAQEHTGEKDFLHPKSAKILGLDIAEMVTGKVEDTGWGCKGPLQEKRCSWYKEIMKSWLLWCSSLKYIFLPCISGQPKSDTELSHRTGI